MNSSTELIYWFVSLLFAVLVVTLLAQRLLRSLLSYRFTDKSLLIVAFRMVPIYCISYHRIEEIEAPLGWPKTLGDFVTLNFCNKMYTRKGAVRIGRKWGLPVVLSPDDPEEFVRELRHRSHQRTGKGPLV